MVSGSAPGRVAETLMVGKSTGGKGETGSSRKAIAPASASPMVSSVVATGLLMKMRRDVHGEISSGRGLPGFAWDGSVSTAWPGGRTRDR